MRMPKLQVTSASRCSRASMGHGPWAIMCDNAAPLITHPTTHPPVTAALIRRVLATGPERPRLGGFHMMAYLQKWRDAHERCY